MKLFLLFFSTLTLNLPVSLLASGTSDETDKELRVITVLRIHQNLAMYCNIKKEKLELKWSNTKSASTDEKCKDRTEKKWFKDNEEIDKLKEPHLNITKNYTLIITNVTENDIGEYRCETANESKSQSVKTRLIYLDFDPKYSKLPKSIDVLIGEKFLIGCNVTGNPPPKIRWIKGDVNNSVYVEDALEKGHYSLSANIRQIDNGSFAIPKVEYGDRDYYSCCIFSDDIKIYLTTYLRVKNRYAAVWPFLTICGEFLILGLIIYVCERRHKRDELEASETDHLLEQKIQSDHNRDVRQRK